MNSRKDDKLSLTFIAHAVRRPVAVAMGGLVILFTGIYTALHLPLEVTPNTDFPRLTVTTSWYDTSPEIMEAFITSPVEAAAARLTGVRNISSRSSEGSSSVTLEFQRGTDMEFAALALSEELHKVRKSLPVGASPPFITKYVPEEFQRGNFFTARMSGTQGLASLRQMAVGIIRPTMLGVSGVAEVSVSGGQDRELAIRLNESAMRAQRVDERDVEAALTTLVYHKSVGAIGQNGQRRVLFVDMPLDSIITIEDAVIKVQDGVPVRLSDIADVSDSYGFPNSLTRIDGNPSVTIHIEKETGKNTIRVADAVTAKLKEIIERLPSGIEFIILEDQSQQIRTELSTLSRRALYSVAVIFVVLLAFLSTLRAPIIILSTILFSVLLAFNGFVLAGMTLNLLTLAGLALGFGMLVDNAIVVVENITKYRQNGFPILQASEKGASEVAMPVLAATLTTLAAFVPFLYLTGELRLYYLPFTLAVGFSLLASMVVAFVMTPSLMARLYRERGPGKEMRWTGRLRRGYASFLAATLRHRGVTLTLTVVVVLISFRIFDQKVSKGEIWNYGGNRKETLNVSLRMPRGTRLDRTDAIISRFEKEAVGQSGVYRVETYVTDESARMTVRFTDAGLNSIVPYLIKEKFAAEAANIAGFTITIYGFGDPFYTGGVMGQNFSNRLEILGYNFQEVKNIAEDLAVRLKRNPRVREVDTDVSSSWLGSGQEMVLRINRERLSMYDVEPAWLLQRLQSHLRENLQNSSLVINKEQVPYALKFKSSDNFNIDDLESMLITLPSGETLRLNEVVQLESRRTMSTISRENQQYQRIVAWDFRGPAKLAQRLTDQIVETTYLPPGYHLQQPRWRLSSEEKRQIWLVLALSILLVYMVTAGLFESFLHPFVILLTVPLSLSGVFLIFWLTDTNFNQSAYIGVVLLGGIVVNDSILLVDHINQRRKQGENLLKAVEQGAIDRVRPILMTTLTTIGGLLPLVLAGGDGTADIWYTLALATIGGLLSSTLLTLTVIPSLYVSLEKWRWRIRGHG